MERGLGRKRSYLVRDVRENERNEIHQCGHSGRHMLDNETALLYLCVSISNYFMS